MDIKPVKPIHIALFFALVLLLLGFLSFIFPKNGIQLTESLSIKFLSFEQITEDEPVYANLDSILLQAKFTDSLSQVMIEQPKDTVTQKKEVVKIDTVRAVAEKLRSRIQQIEYPNDNRNMFAPLFRQLVSGNTSKSLIRILHYGDSQIEGDRITRFLRNRFQKKYSGSGPGLLPCFKPVSENSSMKISTSGPWRKHTVMMRSDSTFPRKNYGILGSCARLESEGSLKKGSLNYKISKYSYLSARHFKWARLFFGHGAGHFKLSIYEHDTLLLQDMVDGTGPLNYFGLQLGHTPENLTFEVEGDSLPCFYGLSLDQPTGIAVDNIAWRGSRGAEFYKIQTAVLSRFFRQLNVKMIIFQFGVNVVPLIKSNYDFYERQLIRQLTHLKNAAGDIPILVVGVSDMARKENGWYASYPNIEKIRNAQRNAAFKSNCAFWDMYKAMGGKNSMPSWVFANPSLAQKDFTHFNFRGAKIIAQMLYNAIIFELNKFESIAEQTSQKQVGNL
jgi:lysophospholipase L1-like esterase